MKSDIMANAGLWHYTVIATLLFVGVYISQVVWTFLPRNRGEMDRAGSLPFDDGAVSKPGSASTLTSQEVHS